MSDRKIREAVKLLAGTPFDQPGFTHAEVTGVNVNARTCDCTPIGGVAVTDIPNVQLMTEVDDGFLLIPAIGSTVIVCYSDKNVPYIAMFSELDNVFLIANNGIQFQGGEFGGLAKAIELQSQLNKTNVLLTALIDVINGAPIDEPGSGAPSALQIALKAAITGQELGDYSEIINESVTHGA